MYFEIGAEAAANAVIAGLGDAVRQIEASHGTALLGRPDIYICPTAKCLARNALTPSARAETRPFGRIVILQGRVLMDEQRLQPVLTNELSHPFWFQRGIRCHPRWWVEGLAVESSGGGGGGAQPHANAVLALRDGTRFTDLEESCRVRDSATRAGMGWPMFYRQAAMFVGWLRARDGVAFGSTPAMLRDAAALTPAIESSFGISLFALWQDWQASVAEVAP